MGSLPIEKKKWIMNAFAMSSPGHVAAGRGYCKNSVNYADEHQVYGAIQRTGPSSITV